MYGETILELLRSQFENREITITDQEGHILAEGWVNGILENDDVIPQVQFQFEDGRFHDLNVFQDVINHC